MTQDTVTCVCDTKKSKYNQSISTQKKLTKKKEKESSVVDAGMPLIPARERRRQVDHWELQASKNYVAKPCLTKRKIGKRGKDKESRKADRNY